MHTWDEPLRIFRGTLVLWCRPLSRVASQLLRATVQLLEVENLSAERRNRTDRYACTPQRSYTGEGLLQTLEVLFRLMFDPRMSGNS